MSEHNPTKGTTAQCSYDNEIVDGLVLLLLELPCLFNVEAFGVLRGQCEELFNLLDLILFVFAYLRLSVTEVTRQLLFALGRNVLFVRVVSTHVSHPFSGLLL